jgi:hypothetical protein
MIITILQVFTILAIGHQTDEQYTKCNEISQDEEGITPYLIKADVL